MTLLSVRSSILQSQKNWQLLQRFQNTVVTIDLYSESSIKYITNILWLQQVEVNETTVEPVAVKVSDLTKDVDILEPLDIVLSSKILHNLATLKSLNNQV